MPGDAEIAAGSPLLSMASHKAPRPVPSAAPLVWPCGDANTNFQSKPRPERGSMRRSALAACQAPSPATQEAQPEAGSRDSASSLRQSEMPSGSFKAQGITTMENADIEAMIIALASVVRAYTREAARKKVSKNKDGGVKFDESQYPLDTKAGWKLVPRATTIECFLRRVTIALELDESSLVIGLILLERAMGASPAPLLLTSRTWRPALLIAIVIASKVVYDEKVFLADYRDQLPDLNLEHASAQELAFLELVGYNTTVRRSQYAKYYYALEVRRSFASITPARPIPPDM